MRLGNAIVLTFHLPFLAAAAVLAARIASDAAAVALRPPPRAPALAASAPAPGGAAPALSDDALYRLIGVAQAAPPAAPDADPATRQATACADLDRPLVKTTLGLVLLGGVFPGDPARSLATIAVLATRETRLVAVGDVIAGARFLGVLPVRAASEPSGAFRLVAALCHDGALEYVDPARGAEPPAPVAAPPPGAGPTEGVRGVGPDRYEIDRGRLDRLLDSSAEWRSARIVPDGKLFRLYAIQPGSLIAAIGVENGDAVKRINGYELDSPGKALELYERLRESARVVVELERGGRLVRKELAIVP